MRREREKEAKACEVDQLPLEDPTMMKAIKRISNIYQRDPIA